MKKYLKILIDALQKKENILEVIDVCVDEQEKCITSSQFSLEDYNSIMEKKGKLIEDMNKLDDGFTTVYARISPALKESPVDYTTQIRELQDKITLISDKIALIQAKEMRISTLIDRLVKSEKIAKGTTVVSKVEAANKYKNVMNKNVVTPKSIFMDKKN